MINHNLNDRSRPFAFKLSTGQVALNPQAFELFYQKILDFQTPIYECCAHRNDSI